MTLTPFYRDQAVRQQQAADEATLTNVRERAQKAADAWTTLAVRSERADDERAAAAASKRMLLGQSENPDRGSAPA